MGMLIAGCGSSNPVAPQYDCPIIDDAFELDHIPDTDKPFIYRLIDSLNTGVLPTPIATFTNTGNSSTVHIEVEVRNRQDVTKDNVPEIFLSATVIPSEETDLVGIWTDYVILTCSAGKHQPIFLGRYQNLYQHSGSNRKY